MENINWICKSITVNNNIIWSCHPKIKEHFEATTNTVQLFSAANYGGNSSSFGIGRYTSSQLDKIGPKALQSIKVPSGLVALLYQNADFTGYGKAIIGDNSDLSKVTDSKNTGFNWSNQMQSLIVQPHVALPTSISDSMPKISLVAPDPNSFITAVSDAKLTRIDDKSYLYVDPKNPDNIFWYNAGDLQIIPPFSISAISDLQLWLDGSDPAANGKLPDDSSTLTTWVDKSGKGNNAKDGNPPKFSNKSVVFDGNANFLQTSIPSNPTNETVFIVFTLAENAPNRNNDMLASSRTNGRGFQVLGAPFRLKYDVWAVGGYADTPNDSIVKGKMTLSSGTISNGSGKVYVNGGQFVGGPQSFNTQPGGVTNIGSGAGGDFFAGSIQEVLLFNTSLSDPQRHIIEGYLAWKWGLQSNLPDNHPFKSAAPAGSTSFPKSLVTNFTTISALPDKGFWTGGAISADGKFIVLVNRYTFIWFSTDFGITWKKLNPNSQDWQSVAMSQDASFIIVNANSNYGFWYSNDKGNNWTKANLPAPTYVGAIACSSDASKIYVADQASNTIWKSTDKGQNWSNSSNGRIKGAWNWVCCSDDGSVVAVCSYRLDHSTGYIYVSTDSGNNWSGEKAVNAGWQMMSCSSDGKIMIAGGNRQLWMSKDTGQTWNQVPTPINADAVVMSSDASTIVIGSADNPAQVHISKDMGISWKKTNYSGSAPLIRLFCSRDGSLIFGGTWNGTISMISQ